MKLEKYLAENRITTERFAQLIGASYSAVCKWRVNERQPKAEWILRIARATSNKVNINDWVKE